MKSYKTIIIDDEPLAIEVIEHYLEAYPHFEVIKTFTDSVEAYDFLEAGNSVDLTFTDIAMPEISGIDIVRLAKDRTMFVMTTSYSEYAVESFELEVIDYLLKPFSSERFGRALNRFETLNEQKHTSTLDPSFFVKEGDEFVKIIVEDIDYIQGFKDYAKIVTGNNFCLVLKTLKSIEAILRPYLFMRIHKSYIVPLNKVSQCNGRCVLINNFEIPVGSSYRELLTVFLNKNKL